MAVKKKNNDIKVVKTMDVILVILGVFLLAFVGVMIYLYRVTGGIPDTLVTCVFAICGCECGVMGWIKNCKEKYKDREWAKADAKKRK
jgi:hypothetical protein